MYETKMIHLNDFIKVSDVEWLIPGAYRRDMHVPVRFFATSEILNKAITDLSIEQSINASTLPGIVGEVIVMPDMHQGYGFPIGGIAATRVPGGVISPGAIGYDINCGVRLLSSTVPADIGFDLIANLANLLNSYCPSGVGVKGSLVLSIAELDAICRLGSGWALKKGMATPEDLRKTEEDSCFESADPQKVSKEAKERGRLQLGTLGSGNHFLEVDNVQQIYDQKAAQIMGLQENTLVIQIHCGSRGFGHQVCTDYVHSFQRSVKKYGIDLPDRELVCAPIQSDEGQAYLAAMRAAANYAFCNRQVLAHHCRKAFLETFSGKVKNPGLFQVYDLAHNMGKIENHTIDGQQMKVCVHRKGATRAFGPGSPSIPSEYRSIGQPVLVPGSMGSASWVLVGTSENMTRTFGSCCHGAGRVMSRSQAKREIRGEKLWDDLEKSGITIKAGSFSGLAEEAPLAYKDVDAVVDIVDQAGIARKVARLKPLVVIKG
jgi:tRNA-splicing ligase RtcB (3'-phosphate/5'-hydroxy nucleic acid ligase)